MEAEKFALRDRWRWLLSEYVIVVLGVITALAAQQSVEYFHDRHQLLEARRELTVEAEANRGQLTYNRQAVQTMTTQVDADIALLRATQTSPAKIASKLIYKWNGAWPADGAWQTVRQNGSLGLMPHEELARYTYLYDAIGAVKSSLIDCASSMEQAGAIARRSSDGSLTGRDIEELMTATSVMQAKLAYCARVLHYEEFGLQEKKH